MTILYPENSQHEADNLLVISDQEKLDLIAKAKEQEMSRLLMVEMILVLLSLNLMERQQENIQNSQCHIQMTEQLLFLMQQIP